MSGRALSLVLALYGPAPVVLAQGFFYEGGLSVGQGTYIFTERTTSWSFSNGLAFTRGRLTFRASMPVHLQNTTLVSLSGPGGRLPTGGSASGIVADTGAARQRRSGGSDGAHTMTTTTSPRMGRVEVPASSVTDYRGAVGDPTAELGWRALTRGRTLVGASLLLKAPVADTGSFGTGQWDVGSSIGITQGLGPGGMLGLDLVYWKLGDLPTLDFRDPVSGTATVSYLNPNGWGGGLSISVGTSALDGYDGPAWFGGYISRVTRGSSWALQGGVGLSETSPDFTLGLTWRVRLIPDLSRGV